MNRLARAARLRCPFPGPALAVAILLVTQGVGARPAQAQVQIQGTADALRVEVEKSSVADVLSALGAKFDVRYRSDVPLDQMIDNDSYRGSLSRVISRVLRDYSYIVKRDRASFGIVIVEQRPEEAEAGSPTPDRYMSRRQRMRARAARRR
jgi:hypothetical protein